MNSPIVTRPVWYSPTGGAASFDSLEAGEAARDRPPDAWALYLIMEDGRLHHVFDTPVVARTVHSTMAGMSYPGFWTLHGSLVLSDPSAQRTVGRFNTLIHDNAAVFRRHFGVELFAGSLNVHVPEPAYLAQQLDAGEPAPSIVIPRAELVNQPYYIGDGQAWPCRLSGERFPEPVNCWIFRRKGSRVDAGLIELVAPLKLRAAYHLQHRDPVVIEVLAERAMPSIQRALE